MSENRYKKGSKAPMIILIIVSVIVVAAIICAVIILNRNKNTTNPEDLIAETTIIQISDTENTETQNNQSQTGESSNAENHTHASNQPQQSGDAVVVPTINGGERGEYFSASFSPTSAVDTFTGANCSLKEVFGSSFNGGSIKFNSDGTLSDNLSLTGASSGAYAVEGDQIIATYTNDKNYIITVTKWNDDVPAEIIINYGGYDVYFN